MNIEITKIDAIRISHHLDWYVDEMRGKSRCSRCSSFGKTGIHAEHCFINVIKRFQEALNLSELREEN